MVNWSKVALAAVAFTTVATADTPQREYKGWGLEQEKEQVKRREDPATWDTEMLGIDKKYAIKRPGQPLREGAFPVPKYDLVGEGAYGGFGVMGRMEYPWRDHYVAGDAFSVGRCKVNEKFIGDREEEVFFHILVLSDKKGSNAGSLVSSRNLPHAIGQGVIKTTECEIGYVAFQAADRNAYAIVNMRLFDLRAGRVVIIAPQKDGTLRSMQVEAPVLETKELKDFDAKLLKEPRVVKFLDTPGNI